MMYLGRAFAILATLLLCARCSMCAANALIEELPDYEARINWDAGVVKAVGRGILPGDVDSPEQARVIARSQAIASARRNLALALGCVRVTGSVTIGALSTSSDAIRARLGELVQNAKLVSIRQIYDRSFEAIIQVGIYGKDGLSSVLSGAELIPAADLSSDRMLVVIDVRADGFRPSLFPELLDEAGGKLSPAMSPSEGDATDLQLVPAYYSTSRLKADVGEMRPLLSITALNVHPAQGIMLKRRDAGKLRRLLKTRRLFVDCVLLVRASAK